MKSKIIGSLFSLITLFFAMTGQAQTELVVNGNLESSGGWTLGGGTTISTLSSFYHSATHYLWFGGDTSTDTAYQDVPIPANATSATLSFYYNINSSVSPSSGSVDTFAATIRNASASTLATVGNWSNLNGTSPGSYSQITYNVLPYAGQTIRIYFASVCHLNGSITTNFRIDDVSLLVTTGTTCSYSLNSYSANPAASSGSSSFNVTAGNNCSWTASSDSTTWLHTTSSGSGNGTVSYSYDANSNSSSRTGHITAGGQSFTVTQSGVSCSYSLSSYSASPGSSSGSGSFNITSASGCSWTASSDATTWLHTTSSGSGNGTVNYTYDANTAGSRTGHITAGGQQFAVTQSGNTTTVLYGIDVSHYQNDAGTINWTTVKSTGNKSFVFVKASEGTDIADGCNHNISGCPVSDHTAENIQGATAAGLLVSPYHLADVSDSSTAGAVAEAQYFLSRAGSYIGDGHHLPPALDLESTYGLTGSQLSTWVRAWLQYVQQQKPGITPIIYAARCDLATLDSDLQAYPLWIADWDCDTTATPAAPSFCGGTSWPAWRFKQYNDGNNDGGCGSSCPGITGGVDLDSFHGDLTALQSLENQTSSQSPSIAIDYSGTSIPDGDQSPTASKGTDFGTITYGFQSTARTFTIRNSGNAALNLTGLQKVQFSGNNPSDFYMTAAPSSPVAANGGSTTFNLVFEPTTSGLRSAIVSIPNDDPSKNPYTFTVQGTGQIQQRIDPSLEYSGVTINNGDQNPTSTKGTDFSSVNVGSSVTHYFQFYNYGNVNMTLTGNQVQLSGANSGDFAIVSMPSSPIAPNQYSTIGIKFQPTASNLRSASLLIYFDTTYALGASSPYTVALQGTGVSAQPSMSIDYAGTAIPNGDQTPTTSKGTDFGTITYGFQSTARTFTIRNSGSGALNLTGLQKVQFSGNNPSDFYMTSAPSSPVAANGGSTTFNLVFEPTASGLRSATVSIPNDDPTKNPYTFTVQGTGQIQQRIDPSLEYSGVTIINGEETPTSGDGTDFGTVNLSQSVTHNFQFYNYGNVDMTLTGNFVQFSGANSGDFSIVTSPTSPIAPGQYSTIGVKFQPTASNLRSATLLIYFDTTYAPVGTSSPYIVDLQGTGQSAQPAIISPTPGSTLGSSSTFQWSSDPDVAQYFFYVGSSLGTNDIYGQSQALNLSTTVNNLPLDGRPLYVRLWWQIAGVWNYTDYTYTASFITPPVNDSFANALPVPSSGGTMTGSNIAATKENGEPNHDGIVGGKSVWWKWTAPSNGVATVDTFGSSFDTVLAVYTGSAVTNLVQVAANDDSGSTVTSQTNFNAIAGSTYDIAVDGFGGASGNIVLHLALVPSVTMATFTGAGGGPLQPPVNGQFQIEVQSSQPQVVVQTSSDLLQWADAATLNMVAGKALFIDYGAISNVRRFYRLKP